MREPEQRHYLRWPIRWNLLCPISVGFIVKSSAVQYDTTGSACVLVIEHDILTDGYRDIHDAARAGRAFLHPVRVTVVGEYEPGVALIQSPELYQGTLVFVPEELRPLDKGAAHRHASAAL